MRERFDSCIKLWSHILWANTHTAIDPETSAAHSSYACCCHMLLKNAGSERLCQMTSNTAAEKDQLLHVSL